MTAHMPVAAYEIGRPLQERTLSAFDRALRANKWRANSTGSWSPPAFAILSDGDSILLGAATVLNIAESRQTAVLLTWGMLAQEDCGVPQEHKRHVQRLLVKLWERNHDFDG